MNYYLPHIAITVLDIEKIKKFYTEIGFSIKEELYSKEKKRHFLLLEGYGIEMEVFHFDEQYPNQVIISNLQQVGFQHIAFPADNLEEKKTEILGKGIMLLKDINVSSLGVKNFNLTDPSGFIIEFFEKKNE